MKIKRPVLRPEEVEFFLRLHGLWEGVVRLPRPPPPPFYIETLRRIDPPWRPSRNGSRMKNRISIGSIVQGTHRIPTLMDSIKVQHASPRKPIWKMAASGFSIRPDKRRTQLNPAADRKPQQGGGE